MVHKELGQSGHQTSWLDGVVRVELLKLPACVQHKSSIFFQHSISVGGSFKFHLFAVVEWFKPHPSKNSLGEPTEVWCYDLFEPFGTASYLPVQRINTAFVAAVDKLDVKLY